MTEMTLASWSARAAEIEIEGRAFINGQYTDALLVSDRTITFGD